ncbi:Calmodulin-binding [Carpediemonas membranifera]|uniref:Calmodulin-binding n=1 Tax=Carpediemonas membranifera TaxID=201153 RepID=A0A8J6E487_9EUKA|nr:Calmodulin-binding [Carpediemonas membranifera]|eukprot:KAG9396596.1 Calmodulin-binding [Carpediemonas membranifera]
MANHAHHTYSQVGDILVPSKGIRDDMVRQGLQPRDHSKDNKERLAKIAAEREQKAKKAAEEKERKKLHQPGAIPSYMKQRTRTIEMEKSTNTANIKSPGVTGGITGRGARPLSSSVKKPAPKDAVQRKLQPHHEAGSVPVYLKRRVKAAEEARQKAAEEEAARQDCPEGMVLVPEAQRLELLEIMTKQKEELEKELGRLPMNCDTESLRRRKGEIEKKLTGLDRDISQMSRTKVYIKV